MVEKLSCERLHVTILCTTLEVSRSGYYAWKERPASERKQENERLAKEIREIFDRSRGTYGVPRIHEKLKGSGKNHGKERIRKIMVETGISAKPKKRFVKTTDSEHELPIAERIFQTENQETMPVKPNEVWASDITYVATEEGWLFLAIFLDLFTRKIVGFSGADHMRVELILNALEMALGRQHVKSGDSLVGHSDRGVQYAAGAYKKRLAEAGITASMSRKGNCYDNAYAESFFHSLKVELIHRRTFKTREEAMRAIFEYIEVWYNRERLHSSLGYKTPIEYELAHLAA
jgi:transposase InsO family protein